MNNTFNIQRFGLLLKRQWLEFGKIYLVTLGVALGVIITFYGFATYGFITGDGPFNERSLGFREPLFLIFGFLFITVVASSYFSNLGQKPKAIIDLMIPASTFEKFLTGLFFTAILSTLSYVVIFYLTDLAFTAKISDLVQDKNQVLPFFEKNSEESFKSLFLIIPFFVTSVFLLGSIYFNKFHYIKTAISVMIFLGVISSILFKTGEWLFAGKIRINGGNRSLDQITQSTAEMLGALAILALTLVIWSITYIRLKEKQV